MKKQISVAIAIILIFVGCTSSEKIEEKNQSESQSLNSETTDEMTAENKEVSTTYIDLTNYFNNVDGTAVFLTNDGQEYIYIMKI